MKNYSRLFGAVACALTTFFCASGWAPQAIPITGKITLGGKLDEPDWQRAPVSADFIENMPREKQPALDRAEVRVLYDKDAIYFGVRGFDADRRRFMRLSCDATKYLARWPTSSCGSTPQVPKNSPNFFG